MHRRGFTVVEIIIVITIMGILMTLATVNFRGTQISSRDAERKSDVETIGQYLDIYYSSGTDKLDATFRYPPTTFITSGISSILSYLRDVDETVLEAPGIDDPTQTLTAATNADQTVGGIIPKPSYDQYVYQPLKTADGGTTWTLCTADADDCRKYNIYYRLETDAAIHMVTSKYQ